MPSYPSAASRFPSGVNPTQLTAPGPGFVITRAGREVPEVDLRLAVIRDGEPGAVRVERQGLDQAHAVQGPQHGPRLRVPDGDPARAVLLRAAARREPAAVAAEGEGLDRVRPRLEGPDRARPEATSQRVTTGHAFGPPTAAVASDRPSGPNATAVTGPPDPRSVATGRPRATSQTPTTVRVPSRRRREPPAVGTEGEVPAGPAAGVASRGAPARPRRSPSTGSAEASKPPVPVDPEDPEALAIERQGRDLAEPARGRPGRGDRGPGRRP